MSQSKRPESPIPIFDLHSFDHIRFSNFPFTITYALAAVVGVVSWALLLELAGIINYLWVIPTAGVVVASFFYLAFPILTAFFIFVWRLLRAQSELVYARSLQYINMPARIGEDELVQSVSFVTKDHRNLPDSWVNAVVGSKMGSKLHAWEEQVYIPQGTMPLSRRQVKQPCDRIVFVSEGSREDNLHFHQGGASYKSWAIDRAPSATIDATFLRARQPYVNGLPIPIFYITGSPYVTRKLQEGTKVAGLTKTELENLEINIIEEVAHKQEYRAEVAEARVRDLEGVEFRVRDIAERKKSEMEEWEADAMDTNRPGLWQRMSRRMKITLFTVVIVSGIIIGALALLVRHP